MIRLGGYLFAGPRLLGGWTAPSRAAVYAVFYRPHPERRPERYAVLHIGHSENLAGEGFPFHHPDAHAWLERAGSKWKLHIATLEVPGGNPAHRAAIASELLAIYQPRGNAQRLSVFKTRNLPG
jgi:hypothetical protein